MQGTLIGVMHCLKQRHEEELRRNYLQGRHAGRLLSEAETTGTAAKVYTTIS